MKQDTEKRPEVPSPQPLAWTPELQRLWAARHHDPHRVLGRRVRGDEASLWSLFPGAASVQIGLATGQWAPMERLPGSDLFRWSGAADHLAQLPRLRWRREAEDWCEQVDPYSFPPLLSQYDLDLFSAGKHWHIYRYLGAHELSVAGVLGVRFAVWAPNAERVSVVGDFNQWDGRALQMRSRGSSGVWELFVPGLAAGMLYKYEIRSRAADAPMLKSDPFAQDGELRPGTASRVAQPSRFEWGDSAWMRQRAKTNWMRAPMSVYEVHLGSWRLEQGGGFKNYRALAHELVEYVVQQGYTHIELLPVTEHPFDASWGYQTTGYFAPTRRFGAPDDFRYFVDHCHRAGIGVILDWVPAHFPKDAHALARFDGTPLFEHEDWRLGEHRDWGTLIFNYGRSEVRNFLLASALYWLEEFHIDGLRVDAVASMLYLDYSRNPGEWLPNQYGGNENLDAIELLKYLNVVVHERFPGALVVAEESTSWPMVSRPVYLGGLGFSMKWNMGWMNDTLEYFSHDPIHRLYHHDRLTFGLLYAFTENFVLPFSHDEVVHGKASLLYKMPGDGWQRFAGVRLLLAYQFTQPGKKLNFMTNDIAQGREWAHDRELEWWLLQHPEHAGIQRLVRDLNHLYRTEPALHLQDFDAAGFRWIDCHDATQSILAYLRLGEGSEHLVVVLNFTPVPRDAYRVGVPQGGGYREIFNSDSGYYGGSNCGTGRVASEPIKWMGFDHAIAVQVPPLGAVVFKPE